MASAGPYESQLNLTADRQTCQHRITQFFTGRGSCRPTSGIRCDNNRDKYTLHMNELDRKPSNSQQITSNVPSASKVGKI